MPKIYLNGNSLGDIKAVLFDKDGTLSNSEKYLLEIARMRVEEACKIADINSSVSKNLLEIKSQLSIVYGINSNFLDPNGLMAISSKESNLISTATIFSLNGASWPDSIDIAKEIFKRVDNKQLQIAPKYRNLILPGALNFLKQLSSARIKSAVISNDSAIGIESFISSNHLEEFITHRWSSDDDPSKPNPHAVKNLCQSLEVKPEECALISDADSDMRMAQQAGIGVILGYTAGWTTKPSINEQQCLINHWDEITVHLKPKVEMR
tara:strand:- start:1054 stop:1851 length:798 start_codon:yes stop_codon:yes gene_type:complete